MKEFKPKAKAKHRPLPIRKTHDAIIAGRRLERERNREIGYSDSDDESSPSQSRIESSDDSDVEYASSKPSRFTDAVKLNPSNISVVQTIIAGKTEAVNDVHWAYLII